MNRVAQMNRLKTIHKSLVIHGGSLGDEIEEQKMSILYIEPTDRVCWSLGAISDEIA